MKLTQIVYYVGNNSFKYYFYKTQVVFLLFLMWTLLTSCIYVWVLNFVLIIIILKNGKSKYWQIFESYFHIKMISPKGFSIKYERQPHP